MNDQMTKALARKASELFRANQDLMKRLAEAEERIASMALAAESFQARVSRE